MLAKKRKIKKSKDFKDLFFSTLIIAVFLSFIGFLIFSNLRISQKRVGMKEQIQELEKEINFLEQRNKNLEAGILETETDPYWEARLYEQGFKKPGEQAVIVVPLEKAKDEPTDFQEKQFIENLLDWVLRRN